MSVVRAHSYITLNDPSRAADLRRIVEEVFAMLADENPGVLQYEWYITPDGSQVMVRESFVDTEATLAHIGHTAPLLSRLLEFASFRLDILGPIDERLREAVAAMNPTYYEVLAELAP